MEDYKKITLVLLIGIYLGACSARRSEPIKGPITFKSEEALEGRKLFIQHCHKCHPLGEAGLGPAINNKPLPEFLIRFQARHGLGVMPAFKRDEISKTNLRKISEYLSELRKN